MANGLTEQQEKGIMLQAALDLDGLRLDPMQPVRDSTGLHPIWAVLTEQYFTDEVQSAKQAAQKLRADLVDQGNGKYALENVKLITSAGALFTESDGISTIDWQTAGKILKFTSERGGQTQQNTAGIVGYHVRTTRTQDRTTGANFRVDYIVNGNIMEETLEYRSAWNIRNINFNVVSWDVIISEHGVLQFEVNYNVAYEYFLGDSWRFYNNDTIVKFGSFVVGKPVPDEINVLVFNPVPSSPSTPAHVGSDIAYITSVSGGNGADAGHAAEAPDFMGHGGNGGHGGGGGGAPGFCKKETIIGENVEVDITQKVGRMIAGTGGLGTPGTAGRSGGCFIFWRREEDNSNA